MRVLTFTSLFPNSEAPTHGIFVYQRSAHLARRAGNEVQVVSPVPYFPRWLNFKRWHTISEIPAQEQIGELTVYHPRYLLLPRISMPFHGWSMFATSLPVARRLHGRFKFDYIDAHYVFPDGFAAVLLGRSLKLPVIVTARGTDINVFPTFRLIRPMIRWTLRQASGIIAVSAALKRSMIELGMPPDKILVIGNGVDLQRFDLMDHSVARQRLGLTEYGPILVCVAALKPQKGHQVLISAVAELALCHPTLKLYILGEGEYRSSLEKLICEKGLEKRVVLKGIRPNEELKLWYNAADLSCLVSAREGWPNVITESLACGTPVLATRVGGIPEILNSEELGILVNETVESIAAGLKRALAKNWNREAIALQTRTRTWDHVAAEVEEVFRRDSTPEQPPQANPAQGPQGSS